MSSSIADTYFSDRNKEAIVDLINEKYARNDFKREIRGFAMAIKKHYYDRQPTDDDTNILIKKRYDSLSSKLVAPPLLDQIMRSVIESTANVPPQYVCHLNAMTADAFLHKFFMTMERDLIMEQRRRMSYLDTIVPDSQTIHERLPRSSAENTGHFERRETRDPMSTIFYDDYVKTFF